MGELMYLYVSNGRHVFVTTQPLGETEKSFGYYVSMHPSVQGKDRRGRPPGKLLSNGTRRVSLSLDSVVPITEIPAELGDAAGKILELVRATPEVIEPPTQETSVSSEEN